MKLEQNKILKLDEYDENIQLDTKIADEYIKNKIDRDSGPFDSGLPDTLVIHYTGSTSLNGALHALSKSKRQVSAHFVIDDDDAGSIYQLMPLNKIAWHAGASKMGKRKSINRYSLGIEIVNPGYLTKGSDNFFYTVFNEKIDLSNAIEAKHKNEKNQRYWHKYNPGQIHSVTDLCLELMELFNTKYIVGHDEISPGRKQDPGPLFPIEKLRDIVLQQGKKEDIIDSQEIPLAGYVTSDLLNIREKDESKAQKVALPLEKGQKVDILSEENGWYKVRTPITGWVSSKYIES